jgi:hypothetical protein
MQLRYYVPFKAQNGVLAEDALKTKLLNIEGVAVDASVNANKWQVPSEDLDFVVESLKGAQLRVDHAESALMVVGKVGDAKREGDKILFRAEVGEEKLIEKILRNYVTHVSIQVDSDDVECSKCKRPSRKEGMLIHLCPGAWEIVHKPKVRELSIVASPAYQTTEFSPVGFNAAMNADQWDAIVNAVTSLQSLVKSDDVGSRQKPQGPENKNLDGKEVKPMSVKADDKASPHQAQGVVNTAPGEQAPKQVTYEEFIQQLTQLEKQIKQGGSAATDAEIDAMTKKITDLEAELARRAKKGELGKKISELTKKLSEEGQEEGQEESKAPKGEAEAKRATGQGIVAVDEINKDALGNYDWYKDLLKAHKRLIGFQ